MKVRQIMCQPVIRIGAEEPVSVAARTLAHYNIGALPVCDAAGKLCGMITDRDLVIRCMAAAKNPAVTTVREVMTGQVVSVKPDMHTSVAAHLMGSGQIRRLPVTENGKLCGMLSLGDLASREEKQLRDCRLLCFSASPSPNCRLSWPSFDFGSWRLEGDWNQSELPTYQQVPSMLGVTWQSH